MEMITSYTSLVASLATPSRAESDVLRERAWRGVLSGAPAGGVERLVFCSLSRATASPRRRPLFFLFFFSSFSFHFHPLRFFFPLSFDEGITLTGYTCTTLNPSVSREIPRYSRFTEAHSDFSLARRKISRRTRSSFIYSFAVFFLERHLSSVVYNQKD